MIPALALAAALTFHPIQIAQMAREAPARWSKMRTHVQVDGWVTYMAKEDDGDRHLRICDSPKVKTMDRKHCIVAEIIPAVPLDPPRLGEHVRVSGISRFDAEKPGRHWWEVHPVLSIRTLL